MAKGERESWVNGGKINHKDLSAEKLPAQAQVPKDGRGMLERQKSTGDGVAAASGAPIEQGREILPIDLHTLNTSRDVASLGLRILSPTVLASGAGAFFVNRTLGSLLLGAGAAMEVTGRILNRPSRRTQNKPNTSPNSPRV